ncbi:MAG: phosphotransferase [Chloroflexi bacterium]|nr:phosphotransferase [Chloroflexota bacterium]MCH8115881.1 phosphotransferase [Chloroflexota bacterium]MCI0775350.1 phosphotransferase [Chloroflexota bacterium]MCI0804251.1 phosphotransferase [Chloroflexota bacterium]MCI0808881.1 phosphotransferase [Chloroflexota bacterium]
MAFNPYPSDETEITLDWLNGALAESAHPAAGKIFACEASKLDTEGNTGWYALAQIESEPGSGLPDELFFKVATAYDLAITSQYENYSTEIAFYRDIVPGTPGRFLQFIYGKADESTDRGIVVIEAFDPRLTLDTFRGVSLTDAGLTLTTMAKLQATWWDRPIPATLAGSSLSRFNMFMDWGLNALRPAWHTHREALREGLPPEAHGAVEQVLASPESLLNPLAEFPRTITQVDSRAENVAILEDDGPPQAVIFDWQRAMSGPALLDVAYFIGTSVRVEDQTKAGELLDGYLQEASSIVTEVPELNTARRMLALGSINALLIRLMARSGQFGEWVDSGFKIEDGDWSLKTIVRTANLVELLGGRSVLNES